MVLRLKGTRQVFAKLAYTAHCARNVAKRGRCAQRAYNAAQHYYRGGYAGRRARPWRHLLAARLYALDVYRERGRRYFKSIEEAGHNCYVERQHPASTERYRS